MAAFDFPPTDGEATDGSFQYDAGDFTYAWNGEVWNIVGGPSGGGGGGEDGASVNVGINPPAGSEEGDLWYNSNNGRLHIYYGPDASGTTQWVDVSLIGLETTIDSGGGEAFEGGEIEKSITTPERTITVGSFDLEEGPYWSLAGGFQVPNPTNAVSGMTGVIRCTAEPTAWSSNFSTAPFMSTFPCIVPFYVESATMIRLGNAVEVD